MYTFDFKKMRWVFAGSDNLAVTEAEVLEKLNKAKAFRVSGNVNMDLSWPVIERSFKTGMIGRTGLALGEKDMIELLQDVVDGAFTKKKPGRKPGLKPIKALMKPVDVSTKIVAQRVVGTTVVSTKDTNGVVSGVAKPAASTAIRVKAATVAKKEGPIAFLKPEKTSGSMDIKLMCEKLGVKADDGDPSEIVSDLMKKCREKLEEAESGGDEANASHLQNFMKKINSMSDHC